MFFPIYNQDFWNIFVGYESTSGSNSVVKFGAYQSNFNKNVHHYEGSATIAQSFRQPTWGDPYYQNNINHYPINILENLQQQ